MLFWEAWKAYAHRAGSYQTEVLLNVLYLVVLGPVALIGRLVGARLLDLTMAPGKTSWLVRGARESTLEALRRQF